MSDLYLDFPVHLDNRGGFALTDEDDHIRDMIYQVLFTSPGERVNRPEFGCGLLQMVFMPNSDVIASAVSFMVQGALSRWLSDLISVRWVKIECQEELLIVDVSYTRRDSGQTRDERFDMPLGGR